MSIRSLTKQHKHALIYFSSDDSLMVLPTKYIQSATYSSGSMVDVSTNTNKNAKAESGKIVELSGKNHKNLHSFFIRTSKLYLKVAVHKYSSIFRPKCS